MTVTIDTTAVAALSAEPLDWRYKGIPDAWWGMSSAQLCDRRLDPFEAGAVGPLCTLKASALDHNIATMATWCRDRGVELAPHGKTHMAPALFARQLEAGACALTVATISQLRVYRAFGVSAIILANELVDAAGLRWLAAELDAHPNLDVTCWVDSVDGVEAMTAALDAAGAQRPLDVCVELGMAGGRTGCRSVAGAEQVARAVVESGRLRLVGVAGYEASAGHLTTPEAYGRVRTYLRELRHVVQRLAGLFETDDVIVTAGGSTYFDAVADELTGDWPVAVRTVLRSGCYLTHDDGLYRRTSPLAGLAPALSVWAQVMSVPEPDLALLTMGRRDVSFDQDLPVPYGLPDSAVTKLNDQHAYLRLGAGDRDRVTVGTWVEFGISHPCTVFDKWQLIPVLDDDGRMVELIRTFF